MPEIPHDFFTVETLSTFGGLVLFVSIVTALLKTPIKERWGDWAVRPLAIAVAFLTQLFVVAVRGTLSLEAVGLALVNAFLVAAAASGTHEYLSDPLARKKRPDEMGLLEVFNRGKTE
ncbi:hypothetical protein [Desulfofundulus salinus]|uniref:Holin n=1 Tax=Desulfofundulus salinus TaxID=2419843 RepID=A0A494WTF9_9FIRM|nr:hypothetical protein [Desulfofundulus salinum]RKO66669.1 hypothetical protein D7024_06740 [Desulfofundulus salinum]